MTTAREIIEELGRMFPERLEEPWDSTEGLISGNIGKRVKSVLLTLEFRDNVAAKEADMVILHHPPRFGMQKKVTNPFYKRARLGGRVVYAVHSRLDRTGFSNEALAERLFGRIGYRIERVLDDGTVIAALRRPLGEDAAIKLVKSRLGLESVNVIAKGKTVMKVAIHGGAGFDSHHVVDASKEKVDLYLGGDMGHHLAEHAHFFDIDFIDIGHFTEQEGMARLARVLSERFPKVRFEYVEQKPLWSVR